MNYDFNKSTKTLSISDGTQTYTYPLSKSPNQNRSSDITGKILVIDLTKKGAPTEKSQLWQQRGYLNIKNYAMARAERTGKLPDQEYYSTIWYSLYRQPDTTIIYTDKCTPFTFGLINFALTHGIRIGLEDLYMQHKQVYEPVMNQTHHPLFQRYAVDSIWDQLQIKKTDSKATVWNYKDIAVETLTPENIKLLEKKKGMLDALRNQYMTYYVWPILNQQLEGLTNKYSIDELETAAERKAIAIKYAMADTLASYGSTLSVHDVLRPEIYSTITRELSIWARPFGIEHLRLSAIPFEVTTIKPSSWYKSDPKYGKRTAKTDIKIGQRIKQGLEASSPNDILLAYIQVQYYKEHLSDFLMPEWYICECGYPVHKESILCEHCDWPNIDQPLSVIRQTLKANQLHDTAKLFEHYLNNLINQYKQAQ